MERKCSVCGAHMIYTPGGFQCSFCVNVEPLDSKPEEYGTVQPNVPLRINAHTKRNAARKDKVEKKPKIRKALFILGILATIIKIVLPEILIEKENQKEIVSLEFDDQSLVDIYEQEAEDTLDSEWFYEQAERIKKIGNYTEDGFSSQTMKQAVEMMYGKSADEVTQDDLASILYLDFHTDGYSDEGAFVISYSVADYREFVSDGLYEMCFAYGEEFESTIQTLRFPYDKEDYKAYYEEYINIYDDLHYFNNVCCLKIRDTTLMNYSVFENLSMVDCGYNSISELLEANLKPEQIEILKVEEGDLTGIEKFSCLKKLYVSGIQTQQLELVTQCKMLDTLYCVALSGDIPDGFACLKEIKSLKKLTMENIEIDGAVDGLFALDTLEELRIRNSKFYQAPAYVAVSNKLKVLDMSYVEFSTMPDSGEQHYIDYEDEAIAQKVLQNYYAAAELEELYLDGYLLGDLSGISSFTNLKVLSIADCGIKTLTETDLEGCSMLEELNLSHNQISDISFVRKLPNLKRMNIEGCCVTDLMPLTQCQKLCYVNIKENPISGNPLTNVNVVSD